MPLTHYRYCPNCKTEWTEEEVALQCCSNCNWACTADDHDEELDFTFYPDGE